jgi:hypothetical protein
MSPLEISAIAFACIFGGVLLGMLARWRLPVHQLSQETRNVIKLGAGLVATLSGLVLGLLVASAKSSFDTRDSEIKQACARLVLLDRALARYGPETEPTRRVLRHILATKIEKLWPGRSVRQRWLPMDGEANLEDVEDRLEQLIPTTDLQREHRARVMALTSELSQTRWLLIEQTSASAMPKPFLVIVVFWLTILFISFGLVAPRRNATAVVALLVCALCVATSLFLVLEMDRPFGGIIQISSVPARRALEQMGR